MALPCAYSYFGVKVLVGVRSHLGGDHVCEQRKLFGMLSLDFFHLGQHSRRCVLLGEKLLIGDRPQLRVLGKLFVPIVNRPIFDVLEPHLHQNMPLVGLDERHEVIAVDLPKPLPAAPAGRVGREDLHVVLADLNAA